MVAIATSLPEVDKYISRHPTGHAKKITTQNPNARRIKIQLETSLLALYNLNSTYSLHF